MRYDCGPSWLDTARLLLRSRGQLSYDKQLFLLNQGSGDITDCCPFYSLVLQAWKKIFKVKWTADAIPGLWVFKEPLFFNSLLAPPLNVAVCHTWYLSS